MRQILETLNAIGTTRKLRIITLLNHGELCACHLRDVLECSLQTVHRDLLILERAGLVENCIQNRFRFYRLAGDGSHPMRRQLLDWALAHLEGSKAVESDLQQLQKRFAKPRRVPCDKHWRIYPIIPLNRVSPSLCTPSYIPAPGF